MFFTGVSTTETNVPDEPHDETPNVRHCCDESTNPTSVNVVEDVVFVTSVQTWCKHEGVVNPLVPECI